MTVSRSSEFHVEISRSSGNHDCSCPVCGSNFLAMICNGCGELICTCRGTLCPEAEENERVDRELQQMEDEEHERENEGARL